ncbi:MAG: class I SAM-dependent methyltransferase [Bacteroidetes bacterium]|nr:class I SAM-dependent methyltransferase [Bacteroidota bacterium]
MADQGKRSLVIRILNRVFIILRDYYIDLSVQGRLIGDRRIDSVDPEYGVHNWHSTTYDAVNDFFFKYKYVQINQDDVIADVGCGDGKLINFLLYKGLRNKMFGYEINAKEGAITKKSLGKYDNVTIICSDIFDDFPANVTLFYLFNPFDENLVSKFITHIVLTKASKPTIIYNNPVSVHLFSPEMFDVTIIKMHQYQHGDGKIAIIRFKEQGS